MSGCMNCCPFGYSGRASVVSISAFPFWLAEDAAAATVAGVAAGTEGGAAGVALVAGTEEGAAEVALVAGLNDRVMQSLIK